MTQLASLLVLPRNLREGLEKLIAPFWERSSWLLPAHHRIFFSFLIFSTVLLCKAVWLTTCEWESEASYELRKLNFQILIRTQFLSRRLEAEAGLWVQTGGDNWWACALLPSPPYAEPAQLQESSGMLLIQHSSFLTCGIVGFWHHVSCSWDSSQLYSFSLWVFWNLFFSDSWWATVLSYMKWLLTRLLSKYSAGCMDLRFILLLVAESLKL